MKTVQNSHCVWTRLFEDLKIPWAKYALIDQGQDEVCVAASFAQAMFAAGLRKYAQLRTSSYNMPCPWVLYQRTCQEECRATRRCKCQEETSCEGLCDPSCGTTIVTMMKVLPTRQWVSANLQFVYTVPRVETIELEGRFQQRLVDLLAQHNVVVINLYLYANQTSFFDSHELLISGMGNGVPKPVRSWDGKDETLVSTRPRTLIDFDAFANVMREPQYGIGSPHLVFPTRRGAKQSRGHCVTATGYFERDGVWYVRCRNTYGKRWGMNGDFAIALADIDPDQVHMMAYVPDIYVERV